MREFLRRCPSCGKRFTVRLQSKTLAEDEHDTEQVVQGARTVVTVPILPAGVTYDQIPIERETFDVAYECENCHHKWTETINAVKKA